MPWPNLATQANLSNADVDADGYKKANGGDQANTRHSRLLAEDEMKCASAVQGRAQCTQGHLPL